MRGCAIEWSIHSNWGQCSNSHSGADTIGVPETAYTLLIAREQRIEGVHSLLLEAWAPSDDDLGLQVFEPLARGPPNPRSANGSLISAGSGQTLVLSTRGSLDERLCQSAIHHETRSGDIRRLFAAEPRDHGRDLIRLARTSERHVRSEKPRVLVVTGCGDDPRCHRIYADVMFGKFERERARQHSKCRLRGCVRREIRPRDVLVH
jgi:hypothetical protein